MKDKYFNYYNANKDSKKFDTRHFVKFKNEMDEIVIPLLTNWKNLYKDQLEVLITKFGRIVVRSEFSNIKTELLSDSELAETLLSIGNKYSNNSKVLIEVISSINNMTTRYNLKVTNEIFSFLLKQTENKKVNFYVSIFITELQHFDNYEKKWEYIMSIPNIAPKKKSIRTFRTVIEKNIDKIPKDLKNKAKEVFENFLNKSENLHEATINSYLSTIEKLS